MKKHILIIAAAALMLTGCAAPGEQIVTITADNIPQPAVTPVTAQSPTQPPVEENVPVPTSEATPNPTTAPTPKPTAVPTPEVTAAPAITPTVAPTAQPTPEPTPEPTAAPTAEPSQSNDSSDFGGGVLDLVNSYRSAAGLNALKYSSTMQKAADTRAEECASSFSHTRPNGSQAYTALTDRGISFTAFGENIFAASGMGSVSAEYVVEQWMASSGHRENILRDGFTHMCIGVASKGDEFYVVQLFGAGIS